MMERLKKLQRLAWGRDFLVGAIFLFTALLPHGAWGDDLISCRYLMAQGREILLELNVGTPAPGVVIVIQHVPLSSRVVNSAPQFKKYDQATGEIKWLLTVTGPGTMKVSMQIDRPVQGSEINGEIRYTDPRTGEMVKLPIQP